MTVVKKWQFVGGGDKIIAGRGKVADGRGEVMAARGGRGWWRQNYGWSWMVAQISNAHLGNMFQESFHLKRDVSELSVRKITLNSCCPILQVTNILNTWQNTNYALCSKILHFKDTLKAFDNFKNKQQMCIK